MGARGPIPNREDDLARPRERQGNNQDATPAKRGTLKEISIDWQPDPEWSAFTKQLWESASNSGMADFYQDTDYATLWFVCQELDRYAKPRTNTTTGELYYKQSPEMVKAILSGLNNLGFDEGSRRRVRIELEEPEKETADPASVVAIADYKSRLKKKAA